jgi:hypothetical protein
MERFYRKPPHRLTQHKRFVSYGTHPNSAIRGLLYAGNVSGNYFSIVGYIRKVYEIITYHDRLVTHER